MSEEYDNGYSDGYDQGLAEYEEVKEENIRLRADLAAVTAERDRMREALKPFSWPASAMYEAIHGGEPSDKIINVLFKIGDMRRARAALEGVTEKSGAGAGASSE